MEDGGIPAELRPCVRCGKPRKSKTDRYCLYCGDQVRQAMRRSGYLTPLHSPPPARPRGAAENIIETKRGKEDW